MSNRIYIPKEEFGERLNRLRQEMAERKLDALFVYGDEYRKENLRYVSNYWPIFERGGFLTGLSGEPVVLCAPEGEKLAREISEKVAAATGQRDERLAGCTAVAGFSVRHGSG